MQNVRQFYFSALIAVFSYRWMNLRRDGERISFLEAIHNASRKILFRANFCSAHTTTLCYWLKKVYHILMQSINDENKDAVIFFIKLNTLLF